MNFCLWFTGLPCAGKTTLANEIHKTLHQQYGLSSTILDGDEVRTIAWPELGFSPEDRAVQLGRVAYFASKIAESGGIPIVALVSPHAADREAAYEMISQHCPVVEVHVDASATLCEKRDVKGMWARARAGEITDFTGYDASYNRPVDPAVHIDTAAMDIWTANDIVHGTLMELGCVPSRAYSLFIGRWSPFHNGHKHIIDQALEKGPVAIGVRCSHDLFSVQLRIQMIQSVYPEAYVFSMPDISSVHIGRKVGYDVVRYDVSEDIAGISATEIRRKIKLKDESWRAMVPTQVASVLTAVK